MSRSGVQKRKTDRLFATRQVSQVTFHVVTGHQINSFNSVKTIVDVVVPCIEGEHFSTTSSQNTNTIMRNVSITVRKSDLTFVPVLLQQFTIGGNKFSIVDIREVKDGAEVVSYILRADG